MFDSEKKLKKKIDKLVGKYDKDFAKSRKALADGKPEDAKIYEMRMQGVEAEIKKARLALKELQKKNK